MSLFRVSQSRLKSIEKKSRSVFRLFLCFKEIEIHRKVNPSRSLIGIWIIKDSSLHSAREAGSWDTAITRMELSQKGGLRTRSFSNELKRNSVEKGLRQSKPLRYSRRTILKENLHPISHRKGSNYFFSLGLFWPLCFVPLESLKIALKTLHCFGILKKLSSAKNRHFFSQFFSNKEFPSSRNSNYRDSPDEDDYYEYSEYQIQIPPATWQPKQSSELRISISLSNIERQVVCVLSIELSRISFSPDIYTREGC